LRVAINDIGTNEIKAAYNGSYTLADIESGKAVNEGAYELLTQMGVALTDAGKAQLLGGASKNEVEAVEGLAKGMAAEKSGDIVGALSFLH